MKVWNGRTRHRYAHIKRDGHMVLVKKLQSGLVKFYSRNMIEFDFRWHPVITNLYSRVPPDTTLHCELWKPGENASYIKSGLVAEDKDLILECFSIPTLNHLMPLQDVADIAIRWGLKFIPWHSLCRDAWHELDQGRVDINELDLTVVAGEREGYVLKDSNFSEFYKVKPFKTADLVVLNVKPGKGKYEGQVGALICGLRDHTVVANVSGMTDDERKNLSLGDVGRIVEVKYQYVGDGGRLRHPSFVRFRDDKTQADETLLPG